MHNWTWCENLLSPYSELSVEEKKFTLLLGLQLCENLTLTLKGGSDL